MPNTPPAPNPATRLQALATEIGGALEFMTTHFGPPPLKTLTISPIPGAFGQGFPGLVYLSTLSYLHPSERPSMHSDYQRLFFSELLQSHEIAHQWWGNLVTSASYQDDWIMEALANYSSLIYLEKRKGRKAIDSVMSEYRERLLQKDDNGRTLESAGPIIWGARLNSSQTAPAWRTITYEKGSWILHMLRGRMGDAAFLKMLGEVARRYRFKPMSTENLRQLAAEFLPRNAADAKLENFFEQWVYGTGVPGLKLSYKVRGKAPKVSITGFIAQDEVSDDFSALVPIEVQLSGKRTITKWVSTSSEPVSFNIDVPAVPLKVQLDPGNSLLALRK
jgi:aminopeptidase N